MPAESDAKAKLTLGLLLVGASVLPASGILGSVLGAAGGVGGNWVAEALGGVFGAGPPPAAQLQQAFTNAVREAASTLREQYGLDRVRHDNADAFDLLRDTARSVTAIELPPEAQDLAAVQRSLAAALNQLLHGHPDAQVLLIKQQLLPTTARAFQAELSRNDQAWRLYHGWLLERMLTQSVALQSALADQPAARAQLSNVAALEAHFDLFGEQLEGMLTALRKLLERAALTPAAPDQATITVLQEMEAEAITRARQQASDIAGRLHQRMQAKTISDSVQIATGVR
ncbi:hypothetical protein [Candidatus Chloroploca asiatica]|uniref:Uncharacterized protein n=1 Tax=Candidatus Chloroploca asiatica TaxID=1506545 RepID=A0A2H3KRE8_9CHLR|nr:hypothetical protein [Candidatus Chloroploca asiatica]PDV97775.1 hypothetical protein A9Q02_17690 [Candidatus Chloroploca asiatica]